MRLTRETSRSVSEWAQETFGPASSLLSIAVRANTEMSELLTLLNGRSIPKEAAEECADVAIVLMRLCDRVGYDLYDEIDRKMEINRKREWVLDGNGHGQHRPTAPEETP